MMNYLDSDYKKVLVFLAVVIVIFLFASVKYYSKKNKQLRQVIDDLNNKLPNEEKAFHERLKQEEEEAYAGIEAHKNKIMNELSEKIRVFQANKLLEEDNIRKAKDNLKKEKERFYAEQKAKNDLSKKSDKEIAVESLFLIKKQEEKLNNFDVLINNISSKLGDIHTDVIDTYNDQLDKSDIEEIVSDAVSSHSHYELESRLDDIDSSVSDLEDSMDNLQNSINSFENSLDSLKDSVDNLNNNSDYSYSSYSIESRLDSIESSIQDLENSISDLSNNSPY